MGMISATQHVDPVLWLFLGLALVILLVEWWRNRR